MSRRWCGEASPLTGAAGRKLVDHYDEKALGDIAATLELFADDCYWRDFLAFTWNIKTMEGRAAIEDMLDATLANVQPGWFGLTMHAAAGSSGPGR